MTDKEKIELLEHQLNRLRCFMWLHKTSFKTKRKLSNFEIYDYFDKKDPKRLNRGHKNG